MSRIFLVSSNTIVDPYPVYPVGMAIIASALVSAGHEVCQFDFLAEERSDDRLRKAIHDFGPHYTGISIRNIDAADHFLSGSDWYLSTDLALIKIIRGDNPCACHFRGSAFSVMPEEILTILEEITGLPVRGNRPFATSSTPSMKGGQYRPLPEREQPSVPAIP